MLCPFLALLSLQRREHYSREEGAAAEHAGLEQAAGRAQEELHIMAARELRQPRVQLR